MMLVKRKFRKYFKKIILVLCLMIIIFYQLSSKTNSNDSNIREISTIQNDLNVNTSDYLFSKKNGSAMTNVDYNRLLQKIFGKGIAVDALRSIFLSEKYKDVPAIHEMEATASAMGNDYMTGLRDYVKK